MRSILRSIVALMIAAAIASPACAAPAVAQQSAETASKGHRFREGVESLFRKYGVPAVSVAVYSPDGLEGVEALGIRRVGDPQPVEMTDRFHLASVTKPITATLAATMVDDGLIKWSSTPAQVWPAQAAKMDRRLRTVTLAQLLSHTAGIQPFEDDSELAAVPSFSGSPEAQRAEFAKWLLARPPASNIGTFVYSNGGFGVASAMLEKVSGKSWEQLVRERVLSPLGLTSCGFGWPTPAADQPQGHRLQNGAYAPSEQSGTGALPIWEAAAGDMNCSMVDLGRFGLAQLRGVLHERSLLRRATYKIIEDAPGDYAYGWVKDPAGLSHRGGVTQGWHTFLFVSPKRHIVVALATNAREPGKTDEFMTEVIQLAFDLFGYA